MTYNVHLLFNLLAKGGGVVPITQLCLSPPIYKKN